MGIDSRGTVQAIVLALVGPEIDSLASSVESLRVVRIYNLTSLISLTNWLSHKRSVSLSHYFVVVEAELS